MPLSRLTILMFPQNLGSILNTFCTEVGEDAELNLDTIFVSTSWLNTWVRVGEPNPTKIPFYFPVASSWKQTVIWPQ